VSAMPEPWHLVIRGRVLDVHCGAAIEGQSRVTSRWLASCQACLAVVEADDQRRACALTAADAAMEAP